MPTDAPSYTARVARIRALTAELEAAADRRTAVAALLREVLDLAEALERGAPHLQYRPVQNID